MRLMLAMMLAMVLGLGVTVWADDEAKSEKIKAEDVPKKVIEAVKKDYPSHTIVEIEKETYKNGTIHYDFKLKDKDGKESDVEYDANGKKLEAH